MSPRLGFHLIALQNPPRSIQHQQPLPRLIAQHPQKPPLPHATHSRQSTLAHPLHQMLTRRRSDNTEGVTSLNFGTSDSSLSYVPWSNSTMLFTFSFCLPLLHFYKSSNPLGFQRRLYPFLQRSHTSRLEMN